MPRSRQQSAALGVLALLIAVAGTLLTRLVAAPPQEIELAGYSTSLAGRSTSQRHNARLSAQALDGSVVPPGATFSFNRTVRSWTADRGYVKAPVSYEGELVRAFGGGVCQTSTTLYNAVLLAGLPVVERHPHVFAPSYVAPGRDAAVAQYDIDLRFRNPHPWPIRIRARITGQRLDIRLLGKEAPRIAVEVTTDVISVTAPARLTYLIEQPAGMGGRGYLRGAGAAGYRVLTHRAFYEGAVLVRRELLSDDTYPFMDRVVAVSPIRTP